MPASVLIFLSVIFDILHVAHFSFVCLARLSLSLSRSVLETISHFLHLPGSETSLPYWSQLSALDVSHDVRDMLRAKLYS